MVGQDERILRITVTIGITLILVSLLGSGDFGFHPSVGPGAYRMSVFRATGDIYVTASSPTNQSFSLYVLDSENALKALQDSSLEDTVQLVALENITQYSGTVSIPSAGVYAVLVTPSGNDTAAIDVDISRLYPVPSILVIGSILVAIGLTTMCISYLARKPQQTNESLDAQRTSATMSGTES